MIDTAAAVPAIAMAGIYKSFADGLQALARVDMEVREGEFVSLLGPSGCGKSTVLRLVAGLTEATGGDLSLYGQAPAQARGQGLGLAYVLQDATLLGWRQVDANVALPLELQHTPAEEARERVDGALRLVGLGEFAHHYPRQLSGGMRMRVSIARALVTAPDLLLMDEPFGALDEISRQRLNLDLLRLWEASHWTCLFVTHSVQEAVFLSERVLIMGPRPGHILFEERVPFAHPRAPELRADPAFVALVSSIGRRLQDALQ